MTIEDKDLVDFIGVDPSSKDVVLTVSDHLPWDCAGEHLWLLQEKLNRYIAFIEGGELVENLPSAGGRNVRVELVLKFPPTNEAQKFIDQARLFLQAQGYGLTHRILDLDAPSAQ